MRTGFRPGDAAKGARRGLVLISVLLVSVFLVSAATGFAIFTRRTMRRLDRERRMFTARMASEVVMDAAKIILSAHMGKAHSAGDELFQPRIFAFPDSGVEVTLAIVPLDDKIPVNRLFLPDGKTLRREIETPWRNAWKLAGAEFLESLALDFLDEDLEPRLGGDEKPGFLNRSPISIEELLLIPGMTPQLLHGYGGVPGLSSFFTVWSSGRINVNSAPAEVLSILEGLDGKIAARIIARREEKPIESITDLATVPGFPADAVPKLMNLISFRSDWFMVSFDVRFEDGEVVPLRSILNGKPLLWKTVRWEEPG